MMERKRQIKSEFNDSELIHFNVNANRLNVTITSMFSQVCEADWAQVPESQNDSSRPNDGQWRSVTVRKAIVDRLTMKQQRWR